MVVFDFVVYTAQRRQEGVNVLQAQQSLYSKITVHKRKQLISLQASLQTSQYTPIILIFKFTYKKEKEKYGVRKPVF